MGWTNRSLVAQTSDTAFPPLTASQHLNSQASLQKDSSDVAELKRIIERQNAQIQAQNAQIRALMNKIETLASNGSSGNARPQNNTTATNNAGGLRKVARRDPPSPCLGRTAGAAGSTQRASNNQEAMDAEEGPASGEEAAAAETATTATTEIPRGGELTAILSAITQINDRLGKMDARLEDVERQLHTLSGKHERLALKVATTSVRNRFASLKKERAEGIKVATTSAKNRFASLKKERAERIKDAIAKRRGRLETSEEDDAEAK